MGQGCPNFQPWGCDDIICFHFVQTKRLWRDWARDFFHWVHSCVISCSSFFFVILFTYNRSLPTQNFSGWLDGRVEHQCKGHPHWGWQWHTAIDLSLCHKFPESFLAWRTCWEKVEVMFNSFIFSLFAIFITFLLFWLGSTWVCVMPCDFCILYKGVLPPHKGEYFSPPMFYSPLRFLSFWSTFTLDIHPLPFLNDYDSHQDFQEESLHLQDINTMHTFRSTCTLVVVDNSLIQCTPFTYINIHTHYTKYFHPSYMEH